MMKVRGSGTKGGVEVQEVGEAGGHQIVEGHDLVSVVLYHYVEFLCVFSGQPFSEMILHTCHMRMVCIQCVFLCELSGYCSD